MNLPTILIACPLAAVLACGGSTSSTETAGFEESALAPAIVDDYADAVVVATYTQLATNLDALRGAVAQLQREPTAAHLEVARAAWVAAREPWEQSEGFLFGPVDAYGFDPALDSWPVNRTDLDAVLRGPDALTESYVRALDPTLKGFHTVEYLLFGAERRTVVSDLTPRQMSYAVAAATEMADVAEQLVGTWTDGSPPYVEIFKTAGARDNRVYPSLQAAGQEIVRGMIGILDEVANGKIADPFDQRDPALVESQFSYNSLADFADNIRSVQHAYRGWVTVPDQRVGFGDFVANVDHALDARVREEIDAAILAIEQIPGPFRDAITDAAAAPKIQAAQEATRRVQSSMEQGILPLVTR